MIVVHDAAVRADRHIYAGSFIIFIPCLGNLYYSRSLSAADTLLLSRDTDRAAADTHLDKISTGICEIFETFPVNYISGTYLHTVAVLFSYKIKRDLLPFRETFG